MTPTGFRGISPKGDDVRQLALTINRLNQGKLSCTGELTLRAGHTTTDIFDPRAGDQSVILLSPLSADAAGTAASVYVSSRLSEYFILTHASIPSTDQKFSYVILG